MPLLFESFQLPRIAHLERGSDVVVLSPFIEKSLGTLAPLQRIKYMGRGRSRNYLHFAFNC